MSDIVTVDLSEFGYSELREAATLLQEMAEHGLPDEMYGKISLCFNKNSGWVFLSDEDYNTCLINDETGKLEMHYSLVGTGEEGFLDELLEFADDWDLDDEYVREDVEQLIGICKANGRIADADRLQTMLDSSLGESVRRRKRTGKRNESIRRNRRRR